MVIVIQLQLLLEQEVQVLFPVMLVVLDNLIMVEVVEDLEMAELVYILNQYLQFYHLQDVEVLVEEKTLEDLVVTAFVGLNTTIQINEKMTMFIMDIVIFYN